MEVALDYLAVGIDPCRTTIRLQSHLPALAELSMLYLNIVTVARLEWNPTIKDEIRARVRTGYSRRISMLSGGTGGGHHGIQRDGRAGRRGSGSTDRANERDGAAHQLNRRRRHLARGASDH